VRLKAGNIVPAFNVQAFTLADGGLRYYVRAEWKSGEEAEGDPTYVLGAWMALEPRLHILAVAHKTSSYGFEGYLPVLLNVIGLGNGKTGLIISTQRDESSYLNLCEYRDGDDIAHMRCLQSIGSAE
jgi:hypothetical protein